MVPNKLQPSLQQVGRRPEDEVSRILAEYDDKFHK